MDGAGSLNHLRLSVRDPDASAALYDPVLTLLAIGVATTAGARQRRRPRAVDRVHELLVELGADVLDAPAEYDYGPGNYAVFFRDPDGFKLEVVHVP